MPFFYLIFAFVITKITIPMTSIIASIGVIVWFVCVGHWSVGVSLQLFQFLFVQVCVPGQDSVVVQVWVSPVMHFAEV